MKTEVSLPDDVFRAAEAQARRTKKSRSQLYAEALAEYLARHAPDEVTEAMNRVLGQGKEPATPSFPQRRAGSWGGASGSGRAGRSDLPGALTAPRRPA
jgi:hypothetical protein